MGFVGFFPLPMWKAAVDPTCAANMAVRSPPEEPFYVGVTSKVNPPTLGGTAYEKLWGCC